MTSTLFTNATLTDGTRTDILVEDGRFAAFGARLDIALRAAGRPTTTVDLRGRLVSAPFCDTHLQLDYVFTSR